MLWHALHNLRCCVVKEHFIHDTIQRKSSCTTVAALEATNIILLLNYFCAPIGSSTYVAAVRYFISCYFCLPSTLSPFLSYSPSSTVSVSDLNTGQRRTSRHTNERGRHAEVVGKPPLHIRELLCSLVCVVSEA